MIGGRTGVPVPIHLGDRVIDAHHDLDIATFHVTLEELRVAGHIVLRGSQKGWPPRFPEVDGGITYCGFPGHSRRVRSFHEITFGIFSAASYLTSASEQSPSILIERQNLRQVHGEGPFSEKYDFGGISGGPFIAIVQTSTTRSWIPAGVIIQGPNPTGDPSQSIGGFELIKARPVQYIRADGHLDVSRWEMNNIHRP